MLDMLAMRARCYRVARVLQSYLDGEVTPPTAHAVEEHLEECRRCGLEAEAYLSIKAAIAAGGGSDAAKVDPDAVARLTAFARELSVTDGSEPA
jgi:anti-sigma factor RsiW